MAQTGYFHSPEVIPGPAASPATTAPTETPRVDQATIDANASLRPLSEILSWNVQPRNLSLREAIQISLSRSDVVRTLGSGGIQIEPVTAYDPALRQEVANTFATVFDPKLTTGFLGSRINEPTGTFFGPGIPQNVRRDEGDFVASVSKTWATGATTTIGYLPPIGYLFFPYGTSGPFNPIYTSDLVVSIQQPLMRGAGWAVNMAPIRVAQLKVEQSVWDCKEALLAHVRSVEAAYWDLQASLVILDAVESVLPLMSEVVRIEGHRAREELSTAADVARATMQFDVLQQQRLQARNDAIAKELRLRNLLASELWDGSRIVPVDAPRLARVGLDHSAAVSNALQHRPDLVRQRLGLRIRELEYVVARNGLKPQLDLQALYRSNGIGQELGTSLQQMMSLEYSDFTIGATLTIPLGNRSARAVMNAAELQLVRDRAVFNQSIQNISFTLADLIREADTAFAQFELAAHRVQNGREWIRVARTRYATPPPSEDANPNWLLLALYDYQNALRMHLEATTDAAQLLARYNTQLVRLEEAQGVLLENRGVDFSEDPCRIIQAHSEQLFGPTSVARLRPRTTKRAEASVPRNLPPDPVGTGPTGPTGIPAGSGPWSAIDSAAPSSNTLPSDLPDPGYDYRVNRQPILPPQSPGPSRGYGAGHSFETNPDKSVSPYQSDR